MGCKRCASDYLNDFGGEVALHVPGLDGLNRPIVWVFPKLTTCLNCGFVEFVLPEEQRELLRYHDFCAHSRAVGQ
jgi:hypothetical protein